MLFLVNNLLNMNSLTTNILLLRSNILLCLDISVPDILVNFCGIIISDKNEYDIFIANHINNNFITYIVGDIGKNYEYIKKITLNPKRYYLIKYFITITDNFKNTLNMSYFIFVMIGEVPINIKNVGIYFRNFFDIDIDFFDKINKEHQFQSITESNKISNAYRTGIYLTDVYQENNDVHYKLLRCSSNLAGPTENFKEIDKYILKKINDITPYYFLNCSELNHVLAQTYHNSTIDNMEKKAKINKTK